MSGALDAQEVAFILLKKLEFVATKNDQNYENRLCA